MSIKDMNTNKLPGVKGNLYFSGLNKLGSTDIECKGI